MRPKTFLEFATCFTMFGACMGGVLTATCLPLLLIGREFEKQRDGEERRWREENIKNKCIARGGEYGPVK